MGRIFSGHRFHGEVRILAVIILLSWNGCQQGTLVGIQVHLFRPEPFVHEPREHLIPEIREMIQVVR